MPRFIGKSTIDNKGAVSDQLDTNINSALTQAGRTGWYSNDWYSQTITADSKNRIKKYCLDFTDTDMAADQPLKRFHQVTIVGNDMKLNAKTDEKGQLIGGFTNGDTYMITAQLPPTFRYSIGGNWTQPLKTVLNFGSNALWSSLTNGQNSGLFGLATMSVWESPNPLEIQLTLSCFDDIGSKTQQNTLEAIDILSRWSLPYMVTEYGMYAGLPGPGIPPVNIVYDKYQKNTSKDKKTGKEQTTITKVSDEKGEHFKLSVSDKDINRLSVMIGGMLFMDYCILKSVDINYVNTKAQYLHDYHAATFTSGSKDNMDAGIRLLPIRCDITLTLSTVMGLTQTNFRNMLALRENNDPRNLSSIDIRKIQNIMDPEWQYKSSVGMETVDNTVTKLKQSANLA